MSFLSDGEGASPVLEVRDVWKSFSGQQVLRGISLSVAKHEVAMLVGASGSGKSTLLRTINLLERVDDGVICLAGEDITDPRVKADAVRARIGVVFQHYNLFSHMSVLRNVTLALTQVHGVARAVAEELGMRALARIGLADKAREYPDRLSGGQQQRVAIARAVVGEPEVLLLDEITSALDPLLVAEVLELVAELRGQGATILMATHEMAFARRAADRVLYLREGEVLEDAPAEQFFTDPVNPLTREFLGSVGWR